MTVGYGRKQPHPTESKNGASDMDVKATTRTFRRNLRGKSRALTSAACFLAVIGSAHAAEANPGPDEIRARAACTQIGLNAMSWHYANASDASVGHLEIECGTVTYMPKRHMIADRDGIALVRPATPVQTAESTPPPRVAPGD